MNNLPEQKVCVVGGGEGNPSTVVGWVNRYVDKLSFDENGVSICPKSNLKYQLLNNKVNIIDE
tara:strand:- start:292 stop:480 length:189 start_codon:yes stop_codon:yes gene_type:complete